MNVLLVTPFFYPMIGGVALHLVNLCKMFHKKNVNLFVLNSSFSNNKNIFNVIDKKISSKKELTFKIVNFIPYFVIIFWRLITDKRTKLIERLKIILYLILHPIKLIHLIVNVMNTLPVCKKIKFDLILAGSANYPFKISYILSRIFNKKVITLAHGNDFLVKTELSLDTNFIKNCDGIITSNNITTNLVQKIHHINRNKIKIIHYGLILDDFEVKKSKEELRHEFNIPNDEFVIICVGMHRPRKKFDLVIKAIKLIKDSNPNIKIKCFLIGIGTETNNLKKIVKELNISNCINFLGEIEDIKRNKYYKLSDIFIMPSVKLKGSIEGFGIVFLEANYYNLPTIGANSGGVIEAIQNNKSGLLVKSNDVNDLKEKILYLYYNEDIRKKMGKYGYIRVINSYNWDHIINDYISYFEDVIQGENSLT